MRVFQIAFEFLMGVICVLMVLMAITMIAYIMKVTLIEIFGSEPFQKFTRWLDETVSDFRTKKR